MRQQSEWQRLFKAEQGSLPRDATPQERAAATRRAARIYRGKAPVATNPSGDGLMKAAFLGLVGYLVLKNLGILGAGSQGPERQ